MSGTVNISRSIWDDTAFKAQPFTEREAFMWLVMEASWKPREKRFGAVVVSLERGQLATSLRFMGDAWNWPKSNVERFLKRIENRDMIGTASGTGVTIITISKYNEYQNAPDGRGTAQNTKAGQQRDSSGTNYKKGVIPEAISKEEEPNGSMLFPPAIDEIAQAVTAYNSTASRAGWPEVQKVTPARRSALRKRLSECGGATGWEVALAKAEASDFLTGQTAKPFMASFDWLTSPTNFTKLLEGNYDNRCEQRFQGNGDGGRGRQPTGIAGIVSQLVAEGKI